MILQSIPNGSGIKFCEIRKSSGRAPRPRRGQWFINTPAWRTGTLIVSKPPQGAAQGAVMELAERGQPSPVPLKGLSYLQRHLFSGRVPQHPPDSPEKGGSRALPTLSACLPQRVPAKARSSRESASCPSPRARRGLGGPGRIGCSSHHRPAPTVTPSLAPPLPRGARQRPRAAARLPPCCHPQ